MLLALFVVFKLFDRDLINLLLTAYFVVRFPTKPAEHPADQLAVRSLAGMSAPSSCIVPNVALLTCMRGP